MSAENPEEPKANGAFNESIVIRLGARNRITLPKKLLEASGLKAGDTLKFEVVDDSRIEITKFVNPILKFAGIATGLYEGFDLRKERDSWGE